MSIALIIIPTALAFFGGYRVGQRNGQFQGIDQALAAVYPDPFRK